MTTPRSREKGPRKKPAARRDQIASTELTYHVGNIFQDHRPRTKAIMSNFDRAREPVSMINIVSRYLRVT